MWDLLPQLGIRSRPPVLGAKSLSHWTTRAVPSVIIFNKKKYFNPMVKKKKNKKLINIIEQSLYERYLRDYTFSITWIPGSNWPSGEVLSQPHSSRNDADLLTLRVLCVEYTF